MKGSKFQWLALLTVTVLTACSDDVTSGGPNPDESKSYFISAEQTATISLPTLQAFAQLSGETEFSKLLKYGVERYNLRYRTTFKGVSIEASGVLYLPTDLREAAPLISLQHGTEFLKSEAPTVTSGATGMEYFASAGYIAFMPDFIGYGQSDEIFHPYYDEASSASCVIDMIKAVKEYLDANQIPFNSKLFLAGYSEGGYVTLAAAKEIETNPDHSLALTAVAAGAGGYDLTAMLSSITNSTTYSYPSYLAFVLTAYNKTYDWQKPASYFFNEPYATAVSTYMTGEYSGSFINSKLTTNVKALLNTDFYSQLEQEGGAAQLKEALANNSISGWQTQTPIRLYHGTKDEIIPFNNSELTLNSFTTAGAPAVTLTPISSGTHGSSFMPMLRDFVPWFEAKR